MERYDLMGIPYATQAEAEAGLDDKNLMTPLKTKQAIEANSPVKTVNGETGDIIVDSLPPGTIIAYAGDTVPDGFVDAGGAAVSRVTYERIFNVFGTKYGAGDGSTTFNLPNLNNGSFLEGSTTAGTVKSAGLPQVQITNAKELKTQGGVKHSAKTTLLQATGAEHGSGANGKGYGSTAGVGMNMANNNVYGSQAVELIAQNSIYGNSDTVQPKSVTVKFCIKY